MNIFERSIVDQIVDQGDFKRHGSVRDKQDERVSAVQRNGLQSNNNGNDGGVPGDGVKKDEKEQKRN